MYQSERRDRRVLLKLEHTRVEFTSHAGLLAGADCLTRWLWGPSLPPSLPPHLCLFLHPRSAYCVAQC